MKFFETATRVARRLTVTVAILVPASLIAASGTAHAQWGGGWGGVDWQWAPPSNPGIPAAGVPYPYGYPYYAVPDYFQTVHAYDPSFGVPGAAYSGYGNAYASGYAQGFGDGSGHGYDNGYGNGYPPIYGNGYPGGGYFHPY